MDDMTLDPYMNDMDSETFNKFIKLLKKDKLSIRMTTSTKSGKPYFVIEAYGKQASGVTICKAINNFYDDPITK